MGPKLSFEVWYSLSLLLFACVVIIAAGIAYAAWKGWPKNFSREMYWTVAMAALITCCFLLLGAREIEFTGRWQICAHYICFVLGVLLSGVSIGSLAAALTYRGPTFSKLNQKNSRR